MRERRGAWRRVGTAAAIDSGASQKRVDAVLDSVAEPKKTRPSLSPRAHLSLRVISGRCNRRHGMARGPLGREPAQAQGWRGGGGGRPGGVGYRGQSSKKQKRRHSGLVKGLSGCRTWPVSSTAAPARRPQTGGPGAARATTASPRGHARGRRGTSSDSFWWGRGRRRCARCARRRPDGRPAAA